MGLRAWYLWKGGLPFASLLGRLFWPRATAGALVTHEDRVLAIDTGDYLMLPMGGLAYGETFAEAARREASEETGVELELGDCIEEGTNAYGGVERVFAAEPARDAPLTDGSWEGRPTWIPISEASTRQWRYDRPVAAYLSELE